MTRTVTSTVTRTVSRPTVLAAAAALLVAGCTGTATTAGSPSVSTSSQAGSSVPPITSTAASSTHAAPPRTSVPRTTAPRTSAVPLTPAPVVRAPAGGGPLIVIDPGHSVSVHGTDPATGLDVSDYENEPEMSDVYSVALLVKQQLVALGYRVVLTKPSLDTPTNLLQRAALANSLHAALAVSLHDQAGSNGGIPFASGNNIVYYQAVGDYRVTPSGHKVSFTDSAVAAVSQRYGQLMQAARAKAEGHAVTLMGNTGYDLASRGLQAGNIWIVQLLSHVPWIYNEAGGNSAGRVGLSSADQQRYANGIVAGIARCVPVR